MTVTQQNYEVCENKSQGNNLIHPRGILLQGGKAWQPPVLLTSCPKFELGTPLQKSESSVEVVKDSDYEF